MAEVAAVAARLGGAGSPAQAIARDVAPAWRELPALADRYDLIRDAQQAVTLAVDTLAIENARSRTIDDPIASDLVLSNMDDVLPGWREADRYITFNGPPRERRPWPIDDRLAQLVWFATSSAQVWIPTIGELRALWQRRQAQAEAAANTTEETTNV